MILPLVLYIMRFVYVKKVSLSLSRNIQATAPLNYCCSLVSLSIRGTLIIDVLYMFLTIILKHVGNQVDYYKI